MEEIKLSDESISTKYPMLTQAFLFDRYVTKALAVEDIALEVGCSKPYIWKFINKFGFKRPRIIRKPSTRARPRPWNFGLNKESDERIAKLSKDRMGAGNPMYGKDAWNKGLDVEDERVRKVANSLIGRKASKETREKQRVAKLGRRDEETNHWLGGISQTAAGYLTGTDDTGKTEYRHRMVVEKLIGHKLSPKIHVHHIDKNRKNNAVNNLLLLSASTHRRLHKAMETVGKEDKYFQIEWLRINNCKFIEVTEIENKINKAA